MTKHFKNLDVKRENTLLNLGLNLVCPAIILMKFSGPEYLGPIRGLIVALGFPISYGLYDFSKRKTANFFSIIGFISILLTGGIGLFKLDSGWVAIKEAFVPFLFGVVILVSIKTRYSVVKIIINNVIDSDRVEKALLKTGKRAIYESKLIIVTILLAASFFLSSILNYMLASKIIVSQPGTSAFNEELGRMTALSFPVIALPSMLVMMCALWLLFANIKKLTGLKLEEIFKQENLQ